MLRIRLLTLAILAVFCLGVVASAAASASEGEFVNKAEKTLEKNKFTSSGGKAVLETVSGTKTECTSETDHGIVTSKTGGEVTILFKGCTTLGLPCTGGEDAGGKAGASELIVLLGFLIKRSTTTTRLVLLTILKTGTKEAGVFKYECSGVKVEVKGSILTSNNFKTKELKKEWELTFASKGAKTGEQSVTEYENEEGKKVKCKGLEASIEGGAFEKASETATAVDKFEEEAQFL
jgi:hypothetical protein